MEAYRGRDSFGVHSSHEPEEAGMRIRWLMTGASVLAIVAVVGVAQADIVMKFSALAGPAKAGKPTGLTVKQDAALTADDPGYQGVAGQPQPQTALIIRLQKGGAFNNKQFPRCKKVLLLKKGSSGCASKTRIGTGSSVASAKPIVDRVNAKLTVFNGERTGGVDHVYVFVLPDLGPTFVVDGTIKKINKAPYGWELTFVIPPIKTLPAAPDAAILSLKVTAPAKTVTKKSGKRKRRYGLIVAPAKCAGKWSYEGEFRFVTGVVKQVAGTQSCKR
jgi:hypothetical protein